MRRLSASVVIALAGLTCNVEHAPAPVSAQPSPTVPASSIPSAPRASWSGLRLAPVVGQKAPCERAQELRARVPGLVSEGKLDRTRRVIARANELCPATSRQTWMAELSTLGELRQTQAAIVLAKTILGAGDGPADAALAATKLLEESRRQPRIDEEGGRLSFEEAGAAFVSGDFAAARRAALEARTRGGPNVDALILAARAARAVGDERAARRLFDRALAEAEALPCGRSECHVEAAEPRRGEGLQIGSMAQARVTGIVAVHTGSSVDLFDRERGLTVRLPASWYALPVFTHDGRNFLMKYSGIEVRDSSTGTLIRRLSSVKGLRSGDPQLFCVSRDGTRVAGLVDAHPSLYLAVWDLAKGTVLFKSKVGGPAKWMGYTGDGRHIVVRHYREEALGGIEEVRLYDARTGRQVRRLPSGKQIAPESEVLATSPDGTSIAGVFDGALQLLDVSTGANKLVFDDGGIGHSRSIEFSPDGRAVLAVGQDGVLVADTMSGKTLQRIESDRRAEYAVFADDERILVYGDGELSEWRRGAKVPERVVFNAPTIPTTLAFSPSHARLLAGQDDGSLAIWDPAATPPLRRLAGQGRAISGLAFTSNGDILVGSSTDGSISVWEMSTERRIRTMTGHAGPITGLAVSPDGGRVATCSTDRTARMWDLASGKLLREIVHPVSVGAITFDAGAGKLITGGEDGKLRVFDASSGAALGDIQAADRPIIQLLPAEAGAVVSCSLRGEMARWDLASGKREHRVFSGIGRHRGQPMARAEDGRTLAFIGQAVGAAALFDAGSWAASRKLVGPVAQSGIAVAPGVERVAVTTLDGAIWAWSDGERWDLKLIAGAHGVAGMLIAAGGHFDFVGPEGDELRRMSQCKVGSDTWPIELCEERLRVHDLFGKVARGDMSFLEP